MRILASLFAVLAASSGCVDSGAEPAEPNQLDGDDKADGNLWAGLTSVTIERSASDPCNNGARPLDATPVVYDDWARQRATIRQVCFEVWSPGVTDWDNPNFWQQLDVQVHYRFGGAGAFTTEHVSSIDRRGNNRRYAWSFGFDRDPFKFFRSPATIEVPFEITSESSGTAFVAANLEFYFTVNNQKLRAPGQQPFRVRYLGQASVPTLSPNANGHVLHDIVTCEQGAARFGSGPGYFATDIRKPSAVAAFQGSLIFAVRTAASSQLVSFAYSSSHPVSGQMLPGFAEPGMSIVPDGTTMRVEMAAFDRATQTRRMIVETFTGCTKTN
jgi:hypothetical protein